MSIKEYWKALEKEITDYLDQHLPDEDKKPSIIYKAMRYSVFAGGKRLRPVLALLVNEVFGGKRESVLRPACAIELIHTYSLIHDDLPSLDNDDLRRGQVSNHKKFGEAIAILAGDALLTLSFQWISESDLKPSTVLSLISLVSQAAGVQGMIGGQVVDLESEGRITPDSFGRSLEQRGIEKDLDYIHLHKTAALIRASVMTGALTAEVGDKDLKKCSQFGTLLGLAFQIVDDILDVEGEAETLGKSVGKDAKSHKLTYPAIYGLNSSKNKAQRLIEESKDIISRFENSQRLIDLADLIIQRKS